MTRKSTPLSETQRLLLRSSPARKWRPAIRTGWKPSRKSSRIVDWFLFPLKNPQTYSAVYLFFTFTLAYSILFANFATAVNFTTVKFYWNEVLWQRRAVGDTARNEGTIVQWLFSTYCCHRKETYREDDSYKGSLSGWNLCISIRR